MTIFAIVILYMGIMTAMYHEYDRDALFLISELYEEKKEEEIVKARHGCTSVFVSRVTMACKGALKSLFTHAPA